MKKTHIYFWGILSVIIFTSCGNENVTEDKVEIIDNEPTFGEDYSTYITEIDNNESLEELKSLSYADPKNNAVQVAVFLNDSSEIMKIEEKYTTESSSSINTNLFYKKHGKKYASIQFFEEKDSNDSLYFVEIQSFYDSSGNCIFSKKRTAEYESYLEFEPFVEIKKTPCSDQKAMDVLNQRGKYQTTFQGFVRGEEAIHLVVGEPKKDGFASALIVQSFTPTVNYLLKNESKMLGTPLEIQFGTDNNDQLLFDVKIVE